MALGDWGTEWRARALAGPGDGAMGAGDWRGDGARRVTVTGLGEVKVWGRSGLTTGREEERRAESE